MLHRGSLAFHFFLIHVLFFSSPFVPPVLHQQQLSLLSSIFQSSAAGAEVAAVAVRAHKCVNQRKVLERAGRQNGEKRHVESQLWNSFKIDNEQEPKRLPMKLSDNGKQDLQMIKPNETCRTLRQLAEQPVDQRADRSVDPTADVADNTQKQQQRQQRERHQQR